MQVIAIRRAYRRLFRTPDGRLVLADLADFCLAEQDTHQPGDPYTSAYHAGMRRVFLRIGSLMNSDDADLRALVRQGADDEDQGDLS